MVEGGAQEATPLVWLASGPGAAALWGRTASVTSASFSTRNPAATHAGARAVIDDVRGVLSVGAAAMTRSRIERRLTYTKPRWAPSTASLAASNAGSPASPDLPSVSTTA